MYIDMSASFEGLQGPAVGADKLDRPDICSFDANSSDTGILSDQLVPFHRLVGPVVATLRPATSVAAENPEFFNNIKREGGNDGQFGSLMGG